MSNRCSNIKIWSARKISFVRASFVRQSCKNDHDALVGLTWVKGTSVKNFFSFLKKRNGTNVSGICRSYICKRYKCAETCREQTGSLSHPGLHFWVEFGVFLVIVFNVFSHHYFDMYKSCFLDTLGGPFL